MEQYCFQEVNYVLFMNQCLLTYARVCPKSCPIIPIASRDYNLSIVSTLVNLYKSQSPELSVTNAVDATLFCYLSRTSPAK